MCGPRNDLVKKSREDLSLVMGAVNLVLWGQIQRISQPPPWQFFPIHPNISFQMSYEQLAMLIKTKKESIRRHLDAVIHIKSCMR